MNLQPQNFKNLFASHGCDDILNFHNTGTVDYVPFRQLLSVPGLAVISKNFESNVNKSSEQNLKFGKIGEGDDVCGRIMWQLL